MLRMIGESSHLLYGSQNWNPYVLSNFSGLIGNTSCEAVGPEASEPCQEGRVLAFGADYIRPSTYFQTKSLKGKHSWTANSFNNLWSGNFYLGLAKITQVLFSHIASALNDWKGLQYTQLMLSAHENIHKESEPLSPPPFPSPPPPHLFALWPLLRNLMC